MTDSPATEEALPTFRYHPDPLATGCVERRPGVTCPACARARGFVYVGPVISIHDDLHDKVCPWCIASGAAQKKLGATFADEEGIGGYGEWDDVSEQVIEEVCHRTPGFHGWQQEQWWTCCDDAAAYLGHAGKDDLLSMWPAAIPAIRESSGMKEGPVWDQLFGALHRDHGPTAYVFRCLHCGKLGGYQDVH